MTDSHAHEADGDRQSYWDSRYSENERLWSGRVNAALADTVTGLPPGTALDLGCGEGGDSLWLAAHGWRVTGVDVSAVALERAATEAGERGVNPDAIAWVQADLSDWQPAEPVDLVSACFLQAPDDFDREGVLRRFSEWVRPNGHMLIVSHAEMPPWSQHHRHEPMPTVQGELDAVEVTNGWDIVIAELRDREAVDPNGEHVTVRDNVILLRRLP